MNKNNLEEYLNKTKLIFFVLLTGQILFFVVSLLIVENNFTSSKSDLESILKILIPVWGIAAMFAANFLYNKKIANVQVNESLAEKLDKYRGLKIIQWALIEGAGFLAILGFILTKNYLYAIVFLFLTGYYILLRPSISQLKTDMKI